MITIQEVRRYLNRAYYLSSRMQRQLEKIAELRSRALRETPSWSDTPPTGSSPHNRLEGSVEKLVLEEERYRVSADRLLDLEREAMDLIGLLQDEKEKAMLEDFHVYRLSMAKIALRYNYDERTILRIRTSGYRKLCQIIERDPDLEDKVKRGEQ